jgi:isoleucyl-tRNA synthetase
VRQGYGEYDFTYVFTSLFNFATTDLSAFYFDIRKDVLYCDSKESFRRRAARTVIDALFTRIVTWLAPLLCFTMEEAWTTRYGMEGSVHLETFSKTPEEWTNEALLEKWNRVRALRRVVTGALEIARRDKIIGASLEAAPTLYVEEEGDARLFDDEGLAEIAITSGAKIVKGPAPPDAFRLPDVPGVGVVFAHASGEKCARCWMILPEVGTKPKHDDLCNRCAEAVG